MIYNTSNAVALKSIKDISKIKTRSGFKKDMEQIKSLFTNDVDISISLTPYNFQQKQLIRLASVKNLKQRKCNQFHNNRTIQRVQQYSPLKLSVLGIKSNSINFKKSLENKILKELKKSKRVYKLPDQHKNINQEQRRSQGMRNVYPNRLTIEQFLKRAQHRQIKQRQSKLGNKKMQTQPQQKLTRLHTKNLDETSLKFFNVVGLDHERSLKKMKSYLNTPYRIKELKRLDRQISQNNAKTQKLSPKKTNDQIGPWKTQFQQTIYS